MIIAWEAVDLHGCTGLESDFPEPSEGLGVARSRMVMKAER